MSSFNQQAKPTFSGLETQIHHGRWSSKRENLTLSLQTSFILQGVLEVLSSQNSRFGSALTQIPDMNGDGFRELVVGAPLEDDHQGAVYVFYGQDKSVKQQYRQVSDAKPGESNRSNLRRKQHE